MSAWDRKAPAEKEAALEAAGFRVGDAADFLGMSEDERRLLDLRLAVSRAVRRAREAQGLTQMQLAGRIGSSQSRVAKLEIGTGGVSLDLLFRALFALGGRLEDLAAPGPAAARAAPTGDGPPPTRPAGKPRARPAGPK